MNGSTPRSSLDMLAGATLMVLTILPAGCNSSATSKQEPTAPATVEALDAASRDALLAALDDERRAEALYRAVIGAFGEVRPFSNIVNAEVRHQALLLPLLEQYGVPTPPNPYDPAAIRVPGTLAEACELGVQAERDNIAIYDRLIPTIEHADIKSAFEILRSASADRHLPAFERCAGRRSAGRGAQ